MSLNTLITFAEAFLARAPFPRLFSVADRPLSHIRDVTSRSPPGEGQQELRGGEDKSSWRLRAGELFLLSLRWLSRGTRSTWFDRLIDTSAPRSDIIRAGDSDTTGNVRWFKRQTTGEISCRLTCPYHYPENKGAKGRNSKDTLISPRIRASSCSHDGQTPLIHAGKLGGNVWAT